MQSLRENRTGYSAENIDCFHRWKLQQKSTFGQILFIHLYWTNWQV